MKLFILRPKDDEQGSPWYPWYDSAFGFVIRAETAKEARIIAAKTQGSENDRNPQAWLDPKLSSCRELKPEGRKGIVITDFRRA